jgi:hypothetical protein
MAIQGPTDASNANNNARIICSVRVGGASLRIPRSPDIEGELSISRVQPIGILFRPGLVRGISAASYEGTSTQKFGYANSAPLGVRRAC